MSIDASRGAVTIEEVAATAEFTSDGGADAMRRMRPCRCRTPRRVAILDTELVVRDSA